MIGNIKGDHYYLNGSQLFAIYKQIESNAFPTYLVVGRDGKILKTVIGFDEEELFDALDKAIKTR